MTRTGKSPRLSQHSFEPCAEFHPDDARRAGLVDGGLTRLRSAWGSMVARARVSVDPRRGCVFVPMHWNSEFAGNGRVNALVNPVVDPISAQPEFKHTPVAAEPFVAKWHAFALTCRRIAGAKDGYWVDGAAVGHWRRELAGDRIPDDWDAWARQRLEAEDCEVEWIAFRDAAAGRYRFASVRNQRLDGCLFVAPDHRLAPRTWLSSLFAEDALTPQKRARRSWPVVRATPEPIWGPSFARALALDGTPFARRSPPARRASTRLAVV